MEHRYTNIRLILDKLLRHPLLQELTLETAIDYTIDFMRIVGVPNMFEDKVETLSVQDYRASLPCDFYQMVQVRRANNKQVFRYTTDTFHLSQNKDERNYQELTYKIQGSVIYTSTKEDTIEIAYKSIATDKDGYPLLIDNSSFTRALELYIKKQWFTILFDLGKIRGDVLQNIQQEYAWAVGDCQTEFNRMSLDQAESFYNSWKTLLVRPIQHSHGFKDNGNQERIKSH